MATAIKAIMAGLIGAFPVAGTSPSAALAPTTSGPSNADHPKVPSVRYVRHAPSHHKAVWSEQDQKSFWEQQADHRG